MTTAAEHAEALLKSGYTEVAEFKNLKVGARVRRAAERYPEAKRHGTGTVERIFHKPNSSWSQSWGAPDVEVIVKRDNPVFGSEHSLLAHYHLTVVYPEDFL